ncbi:MAG TPA: O-antigen ligase family protein [Candidatus Saccharimonadales bacterium]
MKRLSLEKIYLAIVIVIFAGIVVHAPLSVGFGVLFPDAALLIKSWKEILMLVLMPLAIIIVSRRGLWRELANDWIFRIIVAYAALHIILVALMYQGVVATVAGLAIDLRYVLFFGLVYIIIRTMPHYRSLLLKVAGIGAAVVVGFATLQLVLPADILSSIGYGRDTIAPYLTVDKNPDYIRVNSTLRGPNPLGAYAGIVLALIVAAVITKGRGFMCKYAVGLELLTVSSVIALWISYSRSALVGAIVALGVVFAATIMRRLSHRSWIALSVIVCALIGGLVIGQNSSFVSNVLLHENPEGGSTISSNDDHVSSLQIGVDRLLNQPFGGGVGSTGSASLHGDSPIIIENQYLFIAHETGWLGLLLFLVLFGLVMHRLWRQRRDWLALGIFASGISLALIGLLLPVWVDDTVAIIWWGLAAIAITKKEVYERPATK